MIVDFTEMKNKRRCEDAHNCKAAGTNRPPLPCTQPKMSIDESAGRKMCAWAVLTLLGSSWFMKPVSAGATRNVPSDMSGGFQSSDIFDEDPGETVDDWIPGSFSLNENRLIVSGSGRVDPLSANIDTCVPIPKNMSLCFGVEYSRMRLPNLLGHDTMAEVIQQSASWIPLPNTGCHPDTRQFLCSLFTPVCLDNGLDRPIYPCRSLCEAVQGGCEGRMRTYGFSWPEMLNCSKYPVDNDMCIPPLTPTVKEPSQGICMACNQVETVENIVDNFCRADFAVKTKIRKVRKGNLICKKTKIFKPSRLTRRDSDKMRRPRLALVQGPNEPTIVGDQLECCNHLRLQDKNRRYLIMGMKQNNQLIPTFIMPWKKKSKAFRGAIKMFRTLNCDDPKLVSYSMLSRQGMHGAGGRRRGHGNNNRHGHNRGNRHPGLTVTLPEPLPSTLGNAPRDQQKSSP